MSISLDLRASYKETEEFKYSINKEMFESVENSLIKDGQLAATIRVGQDAVGLSLNISITGTAKVECDRCLDDMQIDIDCNENLKIQFADRFEDSDDIIYVPQSQTEIDLWPFVYDFIALDIPLVHVHPDGQCNQEMLNRLSQYMVTQQDDNGTE